MLCSPHSLSLRQTAPFQPGSMYCVMLLFHVPFIRFYHEKKSLNDWEEGIKFMQDKTDLPDFFFLL